MDVELESITWEEYHWKTKTCCRCGNIGWYCDYSKGHGEFKYCECKHGKKKEIEDDHQEMIKKIKDIDKIRCWI